jgi:vancomycin resistance protein YoaR
VASKKRSARKEAAKGEVGRSYKRKLPVEITHDELVRKSKKAGELNKKLAGLRVERRDALRVWKDRLKEDQAVLDKMMSDLETGTEDRDVAVHDEYDYRKNKVRVVREDTGETVEERAMTAEDRQDHLPNTVDSKAEDGEATEDDMAPASEPIEDD